LVAELSRVAPLVADDATAMTRATIYRGTGSVNDDRDKRLWNGVTCDGQTREFLASGWMTWRHRLVQLALSKRVEAANK
jgi:hypothetical protein